MNQRLDNNSLGENYQLHWYSISKVIGRGGFGITYLAQDTNLDRLVAIKEYMPEDFASRESDNSINPKTGEKKSLYEWGLKRFLDEARTLAKFNHPNIVRVLSVFEENNTAYMIMEYAQGKDLSSVYKNSKKFTEEQLLDTFIPVMDGLALVHDAGFIHRDIKPANIYICDNNLPLLLDFGSARQSIRGKTKALTSLVTYGYAPFEQYNESSGKQGPWTDIYAMGASIYVGITGKKPVDSMARGGAFIDRGLDIYEPVSVIAKGQYSENFLLAVDNAQMFKAEDRPQHIIDWAQMLLGKTKAPALPDFMLHPVEDEDKTLIAPKKDNSTAGLMSRGKLHGTQGLVDASGKRNSGNIAKTVLSSANDPATIKTEKESSEPVYKKTILYTIVNELQTLKSSPLKLLSVVSVAMVLILTLSLIFTDFSKPDEPIASKQTQDLKPLPKSAAPQQPSKAQVLLQQKNSLFGKANGSFDAMNYVTPNNNNAYYFYQQILTLEKNNEAALQGINAIETQLLKHANTSYLNKEYSETLDYLSQLDNIHPDLDKSNLLREKVNQQQLYDLKIANWISDAKIHMDNKRYTSPANKNAHEIYRKILNQEAENKQAIQGIESIQQYYVSLFNRHISNSQLKRAKRDVEVMKKIEASSVTIKKMQRQLAISYKKKAAVKKVYPKVAKVPKKEIIPIINNKKETVTEDKGNVIDNQDNAPVSKEPEEKINIMVF